MANIHQELYKHVSPANLTFQWVEDLSDRQNDFLVIWWHDDRSNSIEIVLDKAEVAKLKAVIEGEAE
jgi:hypothetical protein